MSHDVAAGTPSLPVDLFADKNDRHLGETVRGLLKLAVKNPLGTFGLLIIVAFLLIAVFAPLLAPFDFKDFRAGMPREGISTHHWFGTDQLGRDTLSRDIYGARISLSVAFISVLGGSALGTMFGIISGYSGGVVDSVSQRIVDTAIAFPQLLLLLIIVQTLGPSFWTVVIAIMLGIVPGVSRVIRGAALSEKNNQYIEAARSIGASTPRILFRHILPNVMALAIVIMSTLLGAAILAEAGLSFLGLGIPEPAASWGRDVSAARQDFPLKLPAAFFPGAAITLTVLGFNLLGDSVRDIADPRLRGSR
jgi:peptide/nickel transport system permease protein